MDLDTMDAALLILAIENAYKDGLLTDSECDHLTSIVDRSTVATA